MCGKVGTHRVMHVAGTEAWAMLKALKWALEKGTKNVEIQCDVLDVVQWIDGGEILAHPGQKYSDGLL